MYIATLTKSKLTAHHPTIGNYILSESNKLREKENSGMDHIKRLHTLLFSESRLHIHHHQDILVLGSSIAKPLTLLLSAPANCRSKPPIVVCGCSCAGFLFFITQMLLHPLLASKQPTLLLQSATHRL
jgi:hypothetical protein